MSFNFILRPAIDRDKKGREKGERRFLSHGSEAEEKTGEAVSERRLWFHRERRVVQRGGGGRKKRKEGKKIIKIMAAHPR